MPTVIPDISCLLLPELPLRQPLTTSLPSRKFSRAGQGLSSEETVPLYPGAQRHEASASYRWRAGRRERAGRVGRTAGHAGLGENDLAVGGEIVELAHGDDVLH